MRIDLDRVALVEMEAADFQYDGATHRYRAVMVDELLAQYRPPAEVDVALLRFVNGMEIPLPFRERAVMEHLRPAVARAMFLDGKWTSAFPAAAVGDSLAATYARRTAFFGNKMIVASPEHPSVDARAQDFSPWIHADTLIGIELVDGAAYLAQFAVEPPAAHGEKLFRESCRFCHGARKVGAQYGWDFVEPMVVTEYLRRDVGLYYHVRARGWETSARRMPPLEFLRPDDATQLMVWLKALAARPLRPYQPR